MVRSLWLSLLMLACGVSAASAQQWATKMFQVTQHDFGSLAAGAKAEFAFEFQNLYEEDLHVAAVRTSCGCTSPRVTKEHLKTWEKSQVIAKFNTQSFRGQRGATITVVFDKPYYAEVQLTVNGYIRSDVMFEPGEIDFGEVESGSPSERSVSVSYVGRSDWQIVDVRSASKSIEVELDESMRQNGRVNYRMLVRLKEDAKVGYFQDQLTLHTSDHQAQAIPLMVRGSVVSPVNVSPASLFLGVLEPGQKVTKNLIVRGKAPFKVECIECGDSEHFEFKLASQESKSVHVIPVTFTAGEEPGEFSQRLTIKTSLGDTVDCCCVATAKIRDP